MFSIDSILENLSAAEDKLFLSSGNSSLTLTDFLSAVETRKAELAGAGIGQGHIALIAAGKGLQFFVDMCACWSERVTVVPISRHADNAYLSHLYKVLGKPYHEGSSTSIEIISWPNPKFADFATIWFTSGSSGKPKGVRHTFANIVGNAISTVKKIGISHKDRLFTNIPYNFTSLICHFLSVLVSGASLVAIENKLLPKDLWDIIETSDVTCFGGAPIQILWLADSNRIFSRSLDWCMSSGDDLPVSTINKFRSKYPSTNIFTVYGLTELGGRVCILEPNDLDSRSGSVGKPIEGLVVSVMDVHMNELPPGEQGEVVIAGKYLLEGFVEEEFNKGITEFGYKTGDIGYKDQDGFLYLQGRSDDVFKVAGQKVSGLLIRRELLATGWFLDAAVISKTDPAYGALLAAVVVLKEGARPTKGMIINALRKKLPLNHIPREFKISSNIQRTGSGKILKNSLVEYFDVLETLSS